MATRYTIKAEIRDTRKAIQELLGGAQSATISSNGGQHSYTRVQLPELRIHLDWLYNKVSKKNVRKQVRPDFS